MNIWNIVKSCGKKFVKYKWISVLSVFLVVPCLFFSVSALTINEDFLYSSWSKFQASSENGSSSGDCYSYEFSEVNFQGRPSQPFMSISQVIPINDFNYYDANNYGVNLILLRALSPVSVIEPSESVTFSFALTNYFETDATSFQPTDLTVDLFVTEGTEEKTLVFSPSSIISSYVNFDDLSTVEKGYYPLDTEQVNIFNTAYFNFTVEATDKNITIDIFEIAMAYNDFHYGQYTNKCGMVLKDFNISYDGIDKNTLSLISAINSGNDYILNFGSNASLPNPDTDSLDTVLNQDAIINVQAGDAGAFIDSQVSGAQDFLSADYWSTGLLFMKSVLNRFFYPNGSSGGVWYQILKVLIPLGLFSTLIGVSAEIGGRISRKVNRNKKGKGG